MAHRRLPETGGGGRGQALGATKRGPSDSRPALYTFDHVAANVVVAFFEDVLQHVKGDASGRAFRLEPWQRKIVRDVFGWKVTATGRRRYQRVYIEIPRKNGKSSFAAGLALYMLLLDDEPGAEIYSAAGDKEQAAIVFEVAKQMLEGAALLADLIAEKRVQVYRRSIYFADRMAVYKVLSADAPTKHGLNASCIIFDELHTQPNRELLDVLTTSQGARGQPLLVSLTTAGYDRNSVCWEQHEYARQVRDGIIDDPAFYPVIFAADEEDDWTSRETWQKANPNLGVSVSEDWLEGECKRAQNVPAYQNTFRRLHLNQWTQQESRWLDMTAWDKCGRALPYLKGRTCFGGLDLASTTDIAALVLAFPGETRPEADLLLTMKSLLAAASSEPFLAQASKGEPMWLLPFFWIPLDSMMEKGLRDRVPYATWAEQGFIEATPGNVIDYRYIRQRILELAGLYDLREVAYDPWNATQLAVELQGDGVHMVEMRQGFASLSAPTKELLRLVLAGQIGHGGNPVLRWMADNVATKQDPAGNVKPDKSKSTNRIDGIVASIMAVGRAMVADPKGDRSVYEERGVREL